MREERSPTIVSGFFMSGVGVSGSRSSIARDTDIKHKDPIPGDLDLTRERSARMKEVLTKCIQHDSISFY